MKKAIVTGGSQGLGYEIIKLLLERGVSVVNLSRTPCDLDVQNITCDLTSNECIAEAVTEITTNHSDIDLLINNAGVPHLNDTDKLPDEVVDRVLNVNVAGMIKLTSKLLSLLKKNEADIVNVGSTVGFAFKHKDDESVYCSSKWAVRGFTHHLQQLLKKEKVRVIGFHPTGMPTAFYDRVAGQVVKRPELVSANDTAKMLLACLDMPKIAEVSELIINRKS